MGRKSIIPTLETKFGKPIKQIITELISQGKSPDEIASEIGLSKSKVYEQIKELGLKEAVKKARRTTETGGGELQKLFDDYIADKRRANMSEQTIEDTVDTIKNYLWWIEHAGKIADTIHGFSIEYINEFLDYLGKEKSRFGREFKDVAGPVTRSNYRKGLAAFYHWWAFQNDLPSERDPFHKVTKIKIPHKEPEDMADEILVKVLHSFGNSFEGIRNKTIYEWFLETGMRLGGVESLKVNQFDWERGTGKITEKGNKQRMILLSDKLKVQVKKYLEVREPIAKCDALWITASGEAMQSIWKMISTLNPLVQEDIDRLNPGERFHPHLFRHLWAKHMALSEVPAFAMMVMGGWADLELVQHYAEAYIKANPEKIWSHINRASPLSKLV